MTVKYLETKIVETKRTPAPRWGMTAAGYTLRSRAPTRIMIRLDGEKRWRRLMCWCFSNASTAFVRVKGGVLRGSKLRRPRGAPMNVGDPKDWRRIPMLQILQARDLDFSNPDRWIVRWHWTIMTDGMLREHRSRIIRQWRYLRATTKGFRRRQA